MTERTYYSTQTTLAYGIQTDIYANYYLYVAVEFDALGNHPSSNPRSVAEVWCRVANRQESVDEQTRWEDHQLILHQAALELWKDGQIDFDQYMRVLERLAACEIEDAAPVIIIIPHTDDYTIEVTETDAGYEETEEEYKIWDLKPWHDFSAKAIDCDALDLATS